MSEFNKEVVDLVWGKPSGGGVSTSIFRRWSQGFVFSEHEQTALKQFEGGPCAVIAPVQAFLLKNILFNRESSNWRQMSEEEQKTALCSTLSEILESACASASTGFCLVTWAKGQTPHTSTLSKTQTQPQTQAVPKPESSQTPQDPQTTALAAEDLGFEQFHSVLHKRTVLSVSDLREEVLSLYQSWRGCCGVLLFLYSVILTKGIENIRNEIQDPTEPLIDPIHGHGSQSLVNLLVTGHAVSNVWDGDRECSGMKLHGIHKQASVGFLTLMESLRYCKVGAFLKSPKFPIWILGSETHLSVFFTKASFVHSSSTHFTHRHTLCATQAGLLDRLGNTAIRNVLSRFNFVQIRYQCGEKQEIQRWRGTNMSKGDCLIWQVLLVGLSPFKHLSKLNLTKRHVHIFTDIIFPIN